MRILVSRFYPRGVKRERFDLWKREASPTPELLKAYRGGSIDWTEFEKRFKMQLKTQEKSIAAVKELLELSKRRNITLLCYEREGQNCHRQIVKERLASLSHKRNKNWYSRNGVRSGIHPPKDFKLELCRGLGAS